MSELGARLRQARESQGLSLAQAAVETRILQQSLSALETGSFDRLPSDVVARGFLKNYANYLGLSAEEMIEIYRRERGATDKIRVVPATNPPQIRNWSLPSFFGVFFVTIALVGLGYVALNALGRLGEQNVGLNAPTLASTSVVAPPSPLPTEAAATAAPVAVVPPSPSNPRPTSVIAGGLSTTIAPTPATTATPTSNAAIVVEVEIGAVSGNESSWMRIQADGQVVFEGIMRSGEQRVFEAQRRIEVRAGNPPDVSVTVNGLPQGRLGQSPGQPVNWAWPPNS